MSRDRRLYLWLRALSPRRPFVFGLALLLAVAGALALDSESVHAQQLAPQLELDPPCLNLGNDDVFGTVGVTLRGHSFGPDARLVVGHAGQAPDTPPPTPTTDAYGTFQVSFDVPEPSQFGSYTISVAAADTGAVVAETQLVVPCPGTVSVTPACAEAPPPGAQLQIDVSGEGWFNHFTLDVTFEGGGQVWARAEASVNNGSFTTRLSPPSSSRFPLGNGVFAVVVRPRAFDTGPVPEPVSVTPFTIPCYAPAISATPDCGPAGDAPEVYDMSLTGTGFVPLSGGLQPPITTGPPFPVGYLEIIFDAGGIPQRFLHPTTVDGEGNWEVPAQIQPFRRSSGPLIIRVRQMLAPSVVLLEREVLFQIPCPPQQDPNATIAPICGPPAFEGDDPNRRYSLTVNGSGFRPGTLQVYFDALGTSGYPVEEFPGEAAPDGSFSVPLTPLVRPVGRYEVHVTQTPAEGEPIVLQLVFEAPCETREPTMRLECDPLEPAPPERGEVVIESSGWFESAPIQLSVAGQPSDPAATDASGRYTQRLAAEELPDGPLEIVAQQRDVRGTVVAEARSLIVLPCGTPPEPILRVLPETVAPGFVVTVEGQLFPPGEQVSLVWDEGLRADQPTVVTTDENGSFQLQVLVFHRDFLGLRALSATRAEDPSSAYTEPAQLLVVPGRGAPPAFVPADIPNFEPDTRIVFRR